MPLRHFQRQILESNVIFCGNRQQYLYEIHFQKQKLCLVGGNGNGRNYLIYPGARPLTYLLLHIEIRLNTEAGFHKAGGELVGQKHFLVGRCHLTRDSAPSKQSVRRLIFNCR